MMRNQMLLLLLLASSQVMAQRGMVFIKKHGHKVATYEEGSPIIFRTTDGSLVKGNISYIHLDTLIVNNMAWPAASISAVFRPAAEDDAKNGELFLYTTAGVALATTGMTLAKWASFKTALITASVLGYGQYLIHVLPHLKRKKYPIGKKFRLQLIDLHF